MRYVLRKVLIAAAVGLAVAAGWAMACGPGVGGLPPGPPEEPVPGKPRPGGEIEFETPFFGGITAFLVGRVTDCSTGADIPPELIRAEFVFREDAEPPFPLRM